MDVDDVRVLNIVDLLVDEDNFRMEPNLDQPAALKAMVRRQGKKLIALAESLVRQRPSRGEFIWVAPDPRPENTGKYIVCEGNRRVTAIKVLNEPALADGTSWAGAFRELSKEFRDNPIRQLRAILYSSIDEARPDVYRRHTNEQDGAGLEDWDPFAQDRANKFQGKRRTLSMVVLEHLSPTSAEVFAEQLGLRDRTTNADRLLSTFSKKHAVKFGIRLTGAAPYRLELGPNPDASTEILRRILRESAVSVDLIKSEKARDDLLISLLARFEVEQAERADDDATTAEQNGPPGTGERGSDGTEQVSGVGSESTDSSRSGESSRAGEDDPDHGEPADDKADGKGGRHPRRDPLTRNTLAPTDRASTLHVSGTRLTGLYRECREILVDERPNASAMLLRVFLELSCEAFLIHQGTRVPTGRAHWSDFGISLDTKIRKVLNVLDGEGRDRDLTEARNGLSEDTGQSHSIRSLHRAMHDLNQVLDPRQIKLNWQRWHPLFTRIHDAIRG
jgi:hypothetical protein